jgi:hypothetical protein
MREVVRARGHEHVAATHGSTFEVTSDDWLTPAGDCILAIGADRTPADFDADFVAACQDPNATITLTLETDAVTETVHARGHPDLTFDGDRTVAVDADAAAADLNRDLVTALADGADLTLTLAVDSA